MFKIELNTKEIHSLAVRLVRRSLDLSEAMTEIAGIMLDAVEENFKREGRPETWTPLAEATVEDRREKGFGPEHTILQRVGVLAASVQADSGRDEATVHTNLSYAALQPFEGKAGRGKKVVTPPRPFLVLVPEDEIAYMLRKLIDNDLKAR